MKLFSSIERQQKVRISSVDLVTYELDLAMNKIYDRIDEMADKAIQDLEDFCSLLELRADYSHFKFEILRVMPLGIQNDHDERLVRWWAKRDHFGHIVDALIDELSLKGAGIALALRN